jgi:ketosteroid isomerase-like protein
VTYSSITACLLVLGFAHPTVAAERQFKLERASTRFDVQLTVADCGPQRCRGGMTVALFAKGTARKAQTLAVKEVDFFLEKDLPPANVSAGHEGHGVLVFDDFDLDGDEDLAVQKKGAGTLGVAFDIYLFDPTTRQLRKSAAFTRLAATGTLGLFKVDRKRLRLSTQTQDGCCWSQTRQYAVVGGEPVLQVVDTNDNGRHQVQARIAGKMETRGSGSPVVEDPAMAPAPVWELAERWIEAQNSGNFDAYRDCYGDDFTGVRRSGAAKRDMNHDEWMEDRKRMFAHPMKVSLSFPVARAAKSVVNLRATQVWESGSYKDRGLKVMQLGLVAGQWKIVREELLESDRVPVTPSGSAR